MGLSNRIAAELGQFATEPDARNVEFATEPLLSYRDVCRELMTLRRILREKIQEYGDYTLIPGGTLSLADKGAFVRSDPNNPYYGWIENAYGTRVVTASTHLNIGVSDPEELLRTWRVIRAEAHLFLGVTASSPFLNGQITGDHSTRWSRFPKTPEHVPLFKDHASYTGWIEQQLATGKMQNIRHIWLSCRPNGPAAPHELDRLELRICDRIADPGLLLAVTAMLEARVLSVLNDSSLDPLRFAEEDEILAVAEANEEVASRASLEAVVRPWRGGPERGLDHAVSELLEEIRPVMKQFDFDVCSGAVEDVLSQGNVAQQWLAQCKKGHSIQEVIIQAIIDAEDREKQFLAKCCGDEIVNEP